MTRPTNTIASVALGPDTGGPKLVIKSLQITAKAWHGREGLKAGARSRCRVSA